MALINDFLSLIYPRHCQACGILLYRHEQFICNLCRLNLPKSNYHLNADNPLNTLLGGRVPLHSSLCMYLFEKSGKVQRLVHAIKYHQQKELANLIGEWLAQEYSSTHPNTDFHAILPIPLHAKKLEERGFNQSEEFAKGLSKKLNIPLISNALYRAKVTHTQTRKKKFERWENVQGIFQLLPGTNFENKHLLIADDVVTTGATIDSAWQCLKDIPGIRISLACIAFTKPGTFN